MHKLASLKIYSEALNLAEKIYILTDNFPPKEKFGITSQIRRSVASIGANIAEGYSRNSNKETIRFMNIAKASLSETIFFIELSERLQYINIDSSKELLKTIVSLDVKIYNYITYLK